MALEKKNNLRTIELNFTDDKVHPVCHCIYERIIEEDGVQIARNIHREVDDTAKVMVDIQQREYFIQPEE